MGKKFVYKIECRKTAYQENVLSRLPTGDDNDFDRSECGVCAIKVLSLKVKSSHANSLHQEVQKDHVIITVVRSETMLKSKSSGNFRINSTTDVLSMDQKLSFHRSYSPIS